MIAEEYQSIQKGEYREALVRPADRTDPISGWLYRSTVDDGFYFLSNDEYCQGGIPSEWYRMDKKNTLYAWTVTPEARDGRVNNLNLKKFQPSSIVASRFKIGDRVRLTGKGKEGGGTNIENFIGGSCWTDVVTIVDITTLAGVTVYQIMRDGRTNAYGNLQTAENLELAQEPVAELSRKNEPL
jgi:hypothetical protein